MTRLRTFHTLTSHYQGEYKKIPRSSGTHVGFVMVMGVNGDDAIQAEPEVASRTEPSHSGLPCRRDGSRRGQRSMQHAVNRAIIACVTMCIKL